MMFRIPTYNYIRAVLSLEDTTKDNTKLTTMFRLPPQAHTGSSHTHTVRNLQGLKTALFLEEEEDYNFFAVELTHYMKNLVIVKQ